MVSLRSTMMMMSLVAICIIVSIISVSTAPLISPVAVAGTNQRNKASDLLQQKPSELKISAPVVPKKIINGNVDKADKTIKSDLSNKVLLSLKKLETKSFPIKDIKSENLALSEKVQEKQKIDQDRQRIEQDKQQFDHDKQQIEQDSQQLVEDKQQYNEDRQQVEDEEQIEEDNQIGSDEQQYVMPDPVSLSYVMPDSAPLSQVLLENSYQQPKLMEEFDPVSIGGIVPPSAAANYLLLSGDFKGFERAISDLVLIGVMTDDEAFIYNDAVHREYNNLMKQLLSEYNNDQPIYESSNDDSSSSSSSSSQLSVPEIVEYPESEQAEQQQNDYMDELLRNVLNAPWKEEQDNSLEMPYSSESENNNDEGERSEEKEDSKSDSNLEEQLQSLAQNESKKKKVPTATLR